MKSTYALLLLLTAFLACQAPTNTIIVPTQVNTEPLDSTFVDKPAFGTAGTVLNPPFGPRTNGFRLQKVIENGTVKTEYFYDSLGRLTENRAYAGQYTLTSWLYFYEGTTIKKAEYRFNTGASLGQPQYGSLKPGYAYLYNTGTPGLSISRAYRDDLNQLAYPGTNLWFDASGRLVWVESQVVLLEPHQNGPSVYKLQEYRLYTRDVTGNVVRYKYRDNRSLYRTETESVYEYDDKHNPYYTTGDIVELQALSPANVILVQNQTKAGLVPAARYQYTYRPDGYPSKVTFSRNGQPITQEFVYNQ